MHFQGQQLISQSTYVSSRTLVTVALAKVFSIWYGVDTSELEVFGLKLGGAFDQALPILIGFLALNHLLNWLADLHAFQVWNSSSKVGGSSAFGYGGNPLQSQLEDAIKRIGNIEESAHGVLDSVEKGKPFETGSQESQRMQHMVKLSEEQVDLLSKLQTRVSSLTFHGHMYLWGWFCLMPFGVAGYAIYLSTHCL
ncbi:hypothetical protein [Szabonella alba]|uniref:Uncharacterized protein n=1 Tax=Szabonella alba TaxID=2804194 RepID=A0A8K0VDF1_9RHOB|nr:hypothetical protein [Szabonella alba]MBL4917262.1 hypothetical protein [Szabonella alba]